jgi:hypothetical protein
LFNILIISPGKTISRELSPKRDEITKEQNPGQVEESVPVSGRTINLEKAFAPQSRKER